MFGINLNAVQSFRDFEGGLRIIRMSGDKLDVYIGDERKSKVITRFVDEDTFEVLKQKLMLNNFILGFDDNVSH